MLLMQWMANTDDGSNSTGPCACSLINVGLHYLQSLLLLLLKFFSFPSSFLVPFLNIDR